MTYGDFKDLAERTTADKILRNKAFNIAKNPKYYGHQRGLASMVLLVVVLLRLKINLCLKMSN